MGVRRKASARREPVFDVAPADEPKSQSDGGADEAPKRTRARAGDGESRPKKSKRRKRGKDGGNGGGGRKRGLIGRIIYWGAVAALWVVIAGIGVIDLDRRASAADPVARNPEAPALDPDRRPRRPRARDPRRHGRRGGHAEGSCRAMCRRPSSRSRIAASIRITASTRSASRAPLVANVLRRGVSQGGSTITQQLAKNLFLTQERTLTRKLQEVGAGAVARAQVQQDRDPRALSQPRLFRRRRLRRRGRGAALFRQVRRRSSRSRKPRCWPAS